MSEDDKLRAVTPQTETICRACHGSGNAKGAWILRPGNRYAEPRDCRVCHGTGRLPAPETASWLEAPQPAPATPTEQETDR